MPAAANGQSGAVAGVIATASFRRVLHAGSALISCPGLLVRVIKDLRNLREEAAKCVLAQRVGKAALSAVRICAVGFLSKAAAVNRGYPQ